MVNCKDIREIISTAAAGEASAEEEATLKRHIEVCDNCRKEYSIAADLCSMTAISVSEADVIAENIDFADVMRQEIRKSRFSESRRSFFKNLFAMNLKPVPGFAMVFAVGILTGYILFTGSTGITPVSGVEPRALPVAKVEALHARQQVVSFLKESQMILTDMMRDGEYSDAGVKKAGYLLRKSRYFKGSLNSVELMSSRKLLEKISWFLYEISAMERDNYIKEMNRLQLLLEKERLLMKIRLVEKELDAEAGKSKVKELSL